MAFPAFVRVLRARPMSARPNTANLEAHNLVVDFVHTVWSSIMNNSCFHVVA